MPSISMFYGMSVYIYKNDHNPPHIHIITGDKDVSVEISSGKRMKGDKLNNSQMRKVTKWISLHRVELLEMWEKELYIKLEPLK